MRRRGRTVALMAAELRASGRTLVDRLDQLAVEHGLFATGQLASVKPEVRDHDPAIALGAGPDGLDVIRAVERTARRLLRSGGLVVVEHSDRQGVSAPEVFRAAGVWTDIADHRDHDGLDRFVTAAKR